MTEPCLRGPDEGSLRDAARVSGRTGFSLLVNPDSDTRTGVLVKHGATRQIFEEPAR